MKAVKVGGAVAAGLFLIFVLLLAEGSNQRKEDLAAFAELCMKNGGSYSRCHDPDVYDEAQGMAASLER